MIPPERAAEPRARCGLFRVRDRGHGLTGPEPARSQENVMASDDKSRRVEASDGDQAIGGGTRLVTARLR